ncbi:Dyp-type peroxidase [Halomarina litorea]|uniref:Dyp-type peroxidase n=1 Tax=Halomarina litorea TaxID=2961595 RepID=UPI0020C58D84|nr:Dyp-type peroxidase [Halomarina sp. BCD28]
MPSNTSRGVSRRAFVKSAVAIGGASALSACLDREEPDIPRGPEDLSSIPQRQFAWNEVLATDDANNHLGPRHRVLLYLDYARSGTPSERDRQRMEQALRTLEHAYPRRHDGLLFTVSYSPAYFERFDASLPDSVDLPAPEPLSPFEQPEFDTPDAVVHLASDYGSVVLAAEEALLGEKDTLNGVDVEASLGDVFERADRRTGFVGEGLPADHQDVDGIPDSDSVPEDAPLYMGFKSGFQKNQASEDRVAIGDGPFADGTTQHISKIRLRLEDWYGEQDHDDRVGEMFCPFHAEQNLVEGTGESLGESSRVDECAELNESAREYGRVGHSQKTALAREDGSPIILRRDFDSTDGGEAGLHFLSLQRRISDFVKTREAMNATDDVDSPAVRQRVNNGILEYTFVRRRGNYLLPPRSLRALPPADPS